MKLLKFKALAMLALTAVIAGCTNLEVEHNLKMDPTSYILALEMPNEDKKVLFSEETPEYLFRKYGRNTIEPISYFVGSNFYRKSYLNSNSSEFKKFEQMIIKQDQSKEGIALQSCRISVDMPALQANAENLGKVVEGKYGFATVQNSYILEPSKQVPFKIYYTTYDKFKQLANDDPKKASDCIKNLHNYYVEFLKPEMKQHKWVATVFILTEDIYWNYIDSVKPKEEVPPKPTQLTPTDVVVEDSKPKVEIVIFPEGTNHKKAEEILEKSSQPAEEAERMEDILGEDPLLIPAVEAQNIETKILTAPINPDYKPETNTSVEVNEDNSSTESENSGENFSDWNPGNDWNTDADTNENINTEEESSSESIEPEELKKLEKIF